MPGIDPSGAAFTLGLSLNASEGNSRISPTIVALLLVISVAAVPLLLRLAGASRKRRAGDLWGCGRVAGSARMEYTATAFAEPLRRVFAELYRPTRDLSIDFHPASKYFVQSIEYRSEIHPWLERVLYDRPLHVLRTAATWVRRLQGGSVHLYLLYMTLALLVLLTVARWAR
jgi:hypothetical protein